MKTALAIAELISSLSRGAWDDERREAYALVLLSSEVPIGRLGQAARHLLTQIDPDAITPARLIAEGKVYVPPGQAQITWDGSDDGVIYGYGQPTSTKLHPGEGIGGNRPPVVMPSDGNRARLNAQYRRMSAETAEVLRRERARREGQRGDVGPILRSALAGMLARWLKTARHCDWCGERLTEANLKPYLEWCRDLGQHRPLGTPTPEPKVFCAECAAGAISELVDGIAYHAERVPF